MKTTKDLWSTTINRKALPMVLIAAFAAILVTGCASTADQKSDGASTEVKATIPISELYGKEWKLTVVQFSPASAEAADNPAYSRQELEDIGMGDAYTLTIDGERLSGKGAPNRYFGPYKQGEGQSLSIGPIAGTLMAAFKEPEGLKEQAYFGYLEQVNRWNLVKDPALPQLYLYSQNAQGEETVLIFE